jgi:hypothetical protein
MADEQDAIQAIKRFSGVHQTKLRSWLAYAGDGSGNVYTSQANYYLVRYPLASSPTVEIFNNRVNMIDNLRIIVGYTAYQPNLLQVLDVADQRIDSVDPNDNPINPGQVGYTNVLPHWVNHQYLGSDSGLINWRQVSALGVFPTYPASLSVMVWPGTLPRPAGDVNVIYQSVNLTAHVPGSGARYVLISFDSSGTVIVTNGAIVAGGFGALTPADIPATPAGNWRSCAIALYLGQTAIVESTVENDFLDLRFPETLTAGSQSLTLGHFLIGNAANIAVEHSDFIFYDDTYNRFQIGLANLGAISTLIGFPGIYNINNANNGSALVALAIGGGRPAVAGIKVNGTAALPTGVLSGEVMMRLSGRGWGSTTLPNTTRGRVDIVATENWTDTQQGTEIQILITPTGGTTTKIGIVIENSGTLRTTGRKQAVSIHSGGGSYTLTVNDEVVVFTVTATANLPDATGSGTTFRIVCRAGTVTINGSHSDTVKGELTQTLNAGEDLIITDTVAGIWE